MSNPFLGMTVGAWMVFLSACCAGPFKWWTWMVWVPGLTLATLAPLVWWWKHRKPNRVLSVKEDNK